MTAAGEGDPIALVALADLQALDRELGERLRRAVDRVARSGRFVLGPELAAFEAALAERLGPAQAVGVASGSDALHLALRAAGVGRGQVVLTTPLSFVATAEAIVRTGAEPRFLDVDERLCLDPLAVEAYLRRCRRADGGFREPESGARVRALLPVHLYGRVADVAALGALAADGGMALVHDAAQALGADLGQGDREHEAVCLSFFPAKILGAWGDGGAVVTGDARLAETVRRLRVHGRSAPDRYEAVGLNSRLDEIQAAVLREKLTTLDDHLAARRRCAARYDERLAQSPLVCTKLEARDVAQIYTVLVPEGCRDALRAHLAARGIETAVYYPELLCDQPAFRDHLGPAPPEVPRARAATRRVLSLPLHPFLRDADVARVSDAACAFFRER